MAGIRVVIEFGLYDRLIKLMFGYDALQSSVDFSDRVTLEIHVRQSRFEALINDIVEISSGKAVIERLT